MWLYRISVLFLFLGTGGCANIAGNDLGGIINWSPDKELMADAIAWNYCSKYGRAAYVTRINRRPGEYISFRCLTYPVDRVAPPEPPIMVPPTG